MDFELFTKHTTLMHCATRDERFRCWGQKVKVEGHGEINTLTALRAKTYLEVALLRPT